jgi:GDP-4-dehydro-6-deoxy-D-mannose reductase
MRILVTGANGFVGRHACAVLASRGHEVVATDLPPAGGPPSPAAAGGSGAPPPSFAPPFFPSNFTSLPSVRSLLASTRPDAILHLAGIAFVPVADDHPQFVFDVNLQGPLNLLEAVRRDAPSTRVLLVTSAEVYGTPPPGSPPLSEDSPLAPSNLYGVSKAAADAACRLYAARHSLDLLIARPANHIGPGQSPNFVSSAFARQLKDIATGKAPPVLHVGNLDSTRNFTDVRDVVLAYALLLEKALPGTTCNIASPSNISIRDLLSTLLQISAVSPTIEISPTLFRPTTHTPAFSTTRLTSLTGWHPSIPLSQTLSDLYASL